MAAPANFGHAETLNLGELLYTELYQQLEQRRAKLLFQIHHAAVHRGGRDMELFSGPADRSCSCHFVDVAQKPQVPHGHSRCLPSVYFSATV